MTQIQCIIHDYLPLAKRNLWWHPHGPALYRGIRGLMELFYHPRISRRLIGLTRLLAVARRVFQRNG